MNSSQYKSHHLKKVADLLGCDSSEILHITNHIDTYYFEYAKVKYVGGNPKTYLDGTVKKRIVRPPLERLKVIQRSIKNRVLAPILLPENVHGGRKGKSNISNAIPHKGKKYKFTTDLKDFYPSISFQLVYDMFISNGFTSHFAHWLTKLTTWKHSLPQGAITSTHIANLCFLPVDKKIIELCAAYGITYTRYIDDLTFSCQDDFREHLNSLLSLIENSGFKISFRKTSYKGKQTITGIMVGMNYIDAPGSIKAKALLEFEKKSKPFTNYIKGIRKHNTSKISTKISRRE